MRTSFIIKLSFKDHREQMKVLNYFDKFYAKSVNNFSLIYLSRWESWCQKSKACQYLCWATLRTGYLCKGFSLLFMGKWKEFSVGWGAEQSCHIVLWKKQIQKSLDSKKTFVFPVRPSSYALLYCCTALAKILCSDPMV